MALSCAHHVLEGERDWYSLAVAEQGRSSIEKAADLSSRFVLLYSRGRDGLDDAVVVLHPMVVDGDADLVVAVHCGPAFVDHHCPEEIGLVVALLL